jgi:Ca-activated chloride channel family protein
MRCLYCGLLQDEPVGVKECPRCGGELAFESVKPHAAGGSYVQVQMELDQVRGPAGRLFDRHLLVTLRTPEQVPAEHAAPTVNGRPPLSFVAVLDVSGSMAGEKLSNAKEAVRHALRRLRDGDSLSLVVFANEPRCVLEPTEFSVNTIRIVESALAEINAGGMTALCNGLELGIEKARLSRRATTLVLLLSDGQANVGETDLEKVGQRSYQARQESLLVSTIGIGADYNEALMVEIATQGGGRFYHVLYADQIVPYLTGELGEVASLAARQAALELTIPAGGVVMPFTAAYPVQQRNGITRIELGDLPSTLELEVPLRLTVPAQPAGTKLSIEGELVYQSPAGKLLSTALNRVTVRYVDPGQFSLRDGVVAPVVERVLTQMKAAQTLAYSRAAAREPAAAEQVSRQGVKSVHEYASLLGEERAENELRDSQEALNRMAASPAMAKSQVSQAYMAQRAAKKFSDKD